MNDNDVRRIVTRTSTPKALGARASQWAYSRQPFADVRIHLQVRSEGGTVTLEAVDAVTGSLLATAPHVVAMERALGGVVAVLRDIEHEDMGLPLAA